MLPREGLRLSKQVSIAIRTHGCVECSLMMENHYETHDTVTLVFYRLLESDLGGISTTYRKLRYSVLSLAKQLVSSIDGSIDAMTTLWHCITCREGCAECVNCGVASSIPG